jgi:predicted RNA binding protein YcfA (HicA-like mRNA interferase family)
MKASELKRWLKQRGCTFVEEARHTRIVLGGEDFTNAAPSAKEIKTGTLQSILKDLGLKM